MSKPKTKQIELRMPADVVAELRRRIDGTNFTLTQYINAILTCQVIEMLSRERAGMGKGDGQ